MLVEFLLDQNNFPGLGGDKLHLAIPQYMNISNVKLYTINVFYIICQLKSINKVIIRI